MQSLIDHARSFRARATAHGDEFGRLATGQTPDALFITCSDSRVVPSLITGARPGELFELRTAGNIIPRYHLRRPSGEAATIEYAVEVLGVAEVIVCGHSHCGAVGAMLRGDDLTAAPAVRSWLDSTMAPPPHGLPSDPTLEPDIAEAVQRHVLAQLDRLRGYPAVVRRLAAGRLRLHGWFYEIHTGSVLAYRPQAGGFLPL